LTRSYRVTARDRSRQLVEGTRRVVDLALDRVFDEPFEIRSADDFERVMAEHRTSMSFVTAGALTGFVERAVPIARLGTKAGTKVPVPAIKYTFAAIPLALQLGNTVRRGVREVQILASYLVHRLRETGVEPRRGLVTALALSLALDPDRRPDIGLTPGRAAGGLTRQWILRSVGRDTTKSITRRARAEANAVERLDLRALSKEWEGRAV
jgi:hypothetical protein